MKYFVFFFFGFYSLCAQVTIKGFVTSGNNEPLMGASVYVNGTTIGTTTDDKGYFDIKIPSNINAVLVFSYFGFITEYIKISNESYTKNIVLKEDLKELKEVVVNQNKFSRKQMLQLFREQFLGINKAGRNCKILNEEELYFDYDKKSFTFKAYADKPLIIENVFLNYKIQFQLMGFECVFFRLSIVSDDVTSSLYVGTSFFTEISNDKLFLKRRDESYEGSSLQFFRNLVSKKWGKDDFLLFEDKFITDPANQFKISREEGQYKVAVTKQPQNLHKKGFIAEFSMLYKKKQQSKIIFFTNTFYVDKFGLYSNYENIYFSGDITKKRVGNMLPSNYRL